MLPVEMSPSAFVLLPGPQGLEAAPGSGQFPIPLCNVLAPMVSWLLEQRFSKRGPQTGSIGIIWNLVRNAVSASALT